MNVSRNRKKQIKIYLDVLKKKLNIFILIEFSRKNYSQISKNLLKGKKILNN